MSLPALTTPYPFSAALAECIQQAEFGKGEERHGHGVPFVQQPWVSLARNHGKGFLTGQAEKKWIEANTSVIATDDDWYVREVAGAINYALMAIVIITYPEILQNRVIEMHRHDPASVWLTHAWPVTPPRTSPTTLQWPNADSMRLDHLLVSLQNMVLHMAYALCKRLEKMAALHGAPLAQVTL